MEALDKFHWHEALDRAHLALSMFDDFVASHPAVAQTPELDAMADQIGSLMADLYQRIAQLDPH